MLTRIWPVLALCGALVGGCETARPINTCPAPVAYGPDFLAAAADELDALPEGSKLGQMVEDYGQERAALRACRGDD